MASADELSQILTGKANVGEAAAAGGLVGVLNSTNRGAQADTLFKTIKADLLGTDRVTGVLGAAPGDTHIAIGKYFSNTTGAGDELLQEVQKFRALLSPESYARDRLAAKQAAINRMDAAFAGKVKDLMEAGLSKERAMEHAKALLAVQYEIEKSIIDKQYPMDAFGLALERGVKQTSNELATSKDLGRDIAKRL